VHHTPSYTATFSREAVRALDRAAADELGIPGIVLMENAAAAVEEIALTLLAGAGCADPGVLVCCGPGNNGGDGLAAARRLAGRGVRATVLLCALRDRFAGDALTNLRIAERIGLRLFDLDPRGPEASLSAVLDATGSPAMIIDALLGTGLDRPIAPPLTTVVRWMQTLRSQGAMVLAVDIPSGLDCDSGAPIGDAAVRADMTVTLAGRKRGFDNPDSRAWTGEVVIGDIGVPPSLLRRFDQK